MSTKRNALPFVFALVLVITSACGTAATPSASSRSENKAPVEAPIYAAPGNAAPATAAPAMPYAAAPQAPAAPFISNVQSPMNAQAAPTHGCGASQSRGTSIPGSNPANTTQGAYDTFFQNYGVNPRIDTQDEPLSTFGLDVDTGSYTIMRSYINQGSLPPARLRAGGRVCQLL